MIILASQSEIRKSLLENAGVALDILPARIDESNLIETLIAEGAKARDLADALAESKARKISAKIPETYVLGCDQILNCENEIYTKANDPEALLEQLKKLRGKTHQLISAAVFAKSGEPVWRFVDVAQIQFRDFSDQFLNDYIARNFDEVRHSVGGYQLENSGVQLIEDYRGDYFSILGLPLLPILRQLRLWGLLES